MYAARILTVCLLAAITAKDLECNEQGECSEQMIIETDVDRLICSALKSCADSEFELACGLNNCGIHCNEERSCRESQIKMDNVQQIVCDGFRSCQAATFTAWPAESANFNLRCQDMKACRWFALHLFMVDIHSEYGAQIQCNEEEACKMASITIHNWDEQGKTFVIDELDCEAKNACQGLDICVVHGSGKIKKCKCGSTGCDDARGLELCEQCEGSSCLHGAGIGCSDHNRPPPVLKQPGCRISELECQLALWNEF
eukprot:CAMPEP_0197028030 /NCGR_PEP_ID=MMETSP1384-20130603/7839_1 /TAXON_ID=29189 /ORGANISM="Ammonia sp." /LENGTH=256 /DNA_ID=CAMNT_0042456967 /DNA_START=47 /DNA_END=817 /DNA_ORIENTATION=-